MTTTTCFAVDTVDHVAHIRMIRPERANSMIPAFWTELPEIVNTLSDEGRARVIVLSAEGRHFCSGMDTTVFTGEGGLAHDGGHGPRSRARLASGFRAMAMHLQETFTCLERARMPVIAAIQGACVGGGVDMVTAADLRYATEDAFFCIQEINIGMTADVGTLQRLPKLVPPGVVAELAYTGRRMPAARAREVGLVNEVFPDHTALLEGVHAVAAEIASKSPLAVHGTKQTMAYAREHTIADGLEYIATWNASMLDPDDMAEAFRAMADKRPAVYADLPPVRRGI
ncbi:MAG: crotonase/enoyl-CoA hydratase family protein [Actinobacteria bacterium]|nr:crotonase/enoyl-CoA hydratase family protein [Actinomycetota bacterium]